ncbi:LPS export ABC transporter permease LptF [Gammaproteobacteria bacterium]|jgi:lipopolysaccharide export system permease protein|nr:LPS export ABC transporter permease LptF [Gammaproteobacteria bacterium]|tara:strand:+ start:49 stop:1119 length:1071 start_codon:yes stop_codon:yes gene_type:complete
MKILEKYLLKEILRSSLSVLLIFMVILSSNTMLRLIEEASAGTFPTYLLFPVIFVKITQYSIYIIPISLFFGIIIALGRFYNGNEMAIISASGQSIFDIAAIVNKIIIPTFLIVALFSLYITPTVTEYRSKLEHRLNNEERIEEIRPGRFASSQNGKATFFIENSDGSILNKVFFSSSSEVGLIVENSKSATYYKDQNNNRFLLLKDGVIVETLSSVNANTKITEYETHGLMLGKELISFEDNSLKAKNTYDLFISNDLASRAEFQARLMLPLATLILGFLAIPLSYSSPRKGRYDKIFLGSLVYFLYFIAMSITEKMFLLELIPSLLGLWWLHLIMIGIIARIYYQDQNSIPRRQ